LAREIVRVVQAARREAGVGVTDRIELRLGGSPDLLGAARAHERYVAQETLATLVAYVGGEDDGDGDQHTPPVDVDGEPLAVAVAVAQSPRAA
jgi:isoleucyl-tRNA synthetase